MLLDEPTTGQDWHSLQGLLDMMVRLNRQGNTTVMVTHDMDIVAGYATRVIVMAQGKIVLDGQPEEVFYDHYDELNALEPQASHGHRLLPAPTGPRVPAFHDQRRAGPIRGAGQRRTTPVRGTGRGAGACLGAHQGTPRCARSPLPADACRRAFRVLKLNQTERDQ